MASLESYSLIITFHPDKRISENGQFESERNTCQKLWFCNQDNISL